MLLDVARVKGGPLPLGTAIHPADLEEAEEAQGVRVKEGDILLVRTGRAAAPDGYGYSRFCELYDG